MGPWTWLVPLSLSPDVGEPPAVVAIEWVAPAVCPSLEVVQQRVARRVQPGSAQGATARLSVTAVNPGLVLALDLAIPGGAPTQRVVEAAHCDELVDAAALMIAVAIDPIFATIAADVATIVADDAPRVPSPPPMLPISPRATPIDSPPERIAPKNEPRLRVGLRASAGAWFGAMPRPAATIAVDFVIPATRLGWAELGALAIPRQRTDVSDTAGADLWLATAVLRGCIAPLLRAGTKGLARLRPMACGGLAIGAMGGTGRGDIATNTARELWVSPVIGGGLDVAIARRFGVFARFDGHIHARLPGFHLDGIGTVHRVAPGSVTALVGLQAVLP
jgi:hypothetical protein